MSANIENKIKRLKPMMAPLKNQEETLQNTLLSDYGRYKGFLMSIWLKKRSLTEKPNQTDVLTEILRCELGGVYIYNEGK